MASFYSLLSKSKFRCATFSIVLILGVAFLFLSVTSFQRASQAYESCLQQYEFSFSDYQDSPMKDKFDQMAEEGCSNMHNYQARKFYSYLWLSILMFLLLVAFYFDIKNSEQLEETSENPQFYTKISVSEDLHTHADKLEAQS
eukprot:TRINITY_DN23648_c0_g1_i1.p1 TRINITY_DN23648_c0_g1~~TRINITY_DN23648_c0_g1_i1.p1  ORF type:complete len:161 (+),score=7.98 TRINITY_DN23648_c0_g1_i1:55-483(+)